MRRVHKTTCVCDGSAATSGSMHALVDAFGSHRDVVFPLRTAARAMFVSTVLHGTARQYRATVTLVLFDAAFYSAKGRPAKRESVDIGDPARDAGSSFAFPGT